MLEKICIVFLGFVVGGTTFLVTGLSVLLTINQLQNRPLQAQAMTKVPPAQYAQLNSAR